jgi:NADPH2:quinone reductase
MRAVVLTTTCEPLDLRISEQPQPAPRAGEVLIRVSYCALNPLDTHARAGRIKWGVPPMPFTLGYEYAGRVEDVGEGVNRAWIGRRVSTFGCWGGCADYAVAPATALNPVPDALDGPTAAAFFTTTYTSWHLVHTAGRVTAGQTVVVHSAAGAVGVMLTQILKDAGAQVIGLTSRRDKAEWARGFGADHWVVTTEEPYDTAVKRLTGGAGADLIIDGVQGPDAGRNLACLKPFGRVIYIGATGGLAPPVNISQLIGGSLGVQGFVIQHAMALTGGRETPLIEAALASGRWKLPVGEPLPLEAVGQAHADFEARKLVGRTVFRVAGDL